MHDSPSATDDPRRAISRRALFQRVGMSVGSVALASLLAEDLPADDVVAGEGRQRLQGRDPTRPRPTHHRRRARSVIFIHLVGAPSHLDLFDYKPELQRLSGQLMPDDLWKNLRLAFIREQPKLLGTKFQFRPHGESGIELSELLPNLATVVDEMTVVKSLHTEQFNHAPAQVMMHTGFGRFGRPSLGSWCSYGLGTENRNLPAFVVMNTGSIAGAGNSMWGSGFLPSVHQGVEFRGSGDPVLYLSDPPGLETSERRQIVESINQLNRIQLADVGDPEIATRISQYELAYRMQQAVPDLMETRGESAATHALYGTQPGKPGFANNCLLARRLVERGVRFVQINDQGWDHHGSVFSALPKKCKQVDRPIAGLIRDLKQRGLLDETLVVWAAEFGRTPMLQGKSGDGSVNARAGRDHHKDAFAIWMAGGGVKRGFTYGATDELGFHVAADPMHVNDFHATLLHLLGIDHERLTFKFQGRPYRLTDVAGEVAHKLLA